MKKVFASILLVTSWGMAAVAQAYDGIINFTGEVMAETCEVVGGNVLEFKVPTAGANHIISPGAPFGPSQTFPIQLRGCGHNIKRVVAKFEGSGANVDPDTDNLTTERQGVEMRLYDVTGAQIHIGKSNLDISRPAEVDEQGNATIVDSIQYFATKKDVETGPVHASVQYTLTYP